MRYDFKNFSYFLRIKLLEAEVICIDTFHSIELYHLLTHEIK